MGNVCDALLKRFNVASYPECFEEETFGDGCFTAAVFLLFLLVLSSATPNILVRQGVYFLSGGTSSPTIAVGNFLLAVSAIINISLYISSMFGCDIINAAADDDDNEPPPLFALQDKTGILYLG